MTATATAVTQADVDAAYRRLLDHCTTCRRCRRHPHQECRRAGQRLRTWSAARRALRRVAGGRR